MIGISSPGKSYSLRELTDLHLDEVEKLSVVNEVGLVHENNDSRNADLTSEQNVLAGLLERTVGTSNDEDSAVHLSCTGDHVLDIVSVAGAVDVSVVTLSGLVLNVTGVDCDTACLLLGRVVDLVVCQELVLAVLERREPW